MFDYNPMTPTKDELKEWEALTEDNQHKEARKAIGQWAIKNCRDKRIASLMRKCTKDILAIYEVGERTGIYDNDEFTIMCRLTRILIELIKFEYGSDTGCLINSAL